MIRLSGRDLPENMDPSIEGIQESEYDGRGTVVYRV
jgi:hypothetical protein